MSSPKPGPNPPANRRVAQHPAFQRPVDSGARTLNKPLLIGTIIATLLLIPAASTFHHYQLRRNAAELLANADRLEAEGDFLGAAAQIERYGELVGMDLETMQKVASLLDRHQNPTAEQLRRLAKLHETILTLKPSLTKNRRRLSEVFLRLGAYQQAGEQAKAVIEEDKNDPIAQKTFADSLYARRQFAEAQGPYNRVIRLAPADIMSYARLANCHLQLGETQRATTVVNQMVEKNPESAEAHFRRYVFRRATTQDPATKDLEAAVKLDPKNLGYMLTAGEDALSMRRWDSARDYFERALPLAGDNPDDLARVYSGLGNALEGMGRRDDAIAAWKKGLKQLGPNNFALNLRLAEALIRAGELKDVESRLKPLRDRITRMLSENRRSQADLTAAKQIVDWLEARYHLARRSPAEATPLLASAAAGTIGDVNIRFESLDLLGRLAAQYQQWDSAAEYFQRAVVLRPDSVPARYALGDALARAGRYTEALTVLAEVSRNPAAPKDVWLYLARLSFLSQARHDPAERNWKAFEGYLAGCRTAKVDPLETTLLEASRLSADKAYLEASQWLAAGQFAVAVEAFNDVQRRALAWGIQRLAEQLPPNRFSDLFRGQTLPPWIQPKRADDLARLWTSMAQVYDAWDKPAEAGNVIAIGRYWQPQSARLALSDASMLFRSGAYDQALKLIDRQLASTAPANRPAYLRLKIDVLARTDQGPQLLEALKLLAQEAPDDAGVLTQLCEQLGRQGRSQEAEKYMRRIRELEGDDGTQWRYARAMLLLEGKQPPDAKAIEEADKLCKEIQARRPTWSKGALLAAGVAMLQNNNQLAVKELKRAVQLGEARLEVYQKLLSLLVTQGEHSEADALLSELRESILADPGILPIALQLTADKENFVQAESLAREGARRRPDDPRAQAWLGQVLGLAGKNDEAEAALRKAIKLDPSSSEPRLALIRFFVSSNQIDKAQKEIDALAQSPSIGDRPEMVLGYCYSLIKNRNEAHQQYLAAIRRSPDDPVVLRNASAFFLSHQLPEAEETIKRLQKLSPNDTAVLRALVFSLYSRDEAKDWYEGLRLIADQNSAPDVRLKTHLLERLGGPDDIREAIRLLENLASKPGEATPNDRFRLAQLYERAGKMDSAVDQLLMLASNRSAPSLHLATCASTLLKLGRWQGEAPMILSRLEKMEPGRFRTVALRARWLVAAGRRNEAIRLIKKTVADNAGQPDYVPQLANYAKLLSSFGENGEAERMYRELAKRDSKGYQLLAAFLRESGKANEAARLCLKEAESPDEKQRTGALVLALGMSGELDSPTEAEVDKAVQAALQRQGQSLPLLKAVAERDLRDGRVDDAVALYTRCLKGEPKNASLMNNLAIALSRKNRHQDALEQINRAIDLAGPKLELLDSKGLILMQAGELNQAIELLLKVASDGLASPFHYLHLAVAYSRANRASDSRYALEKAKEMGIHAPTLSEGDRQFLAELSGLERKRQ